MGSAAGHVVAAIFFCFLGFFLCYRIMTQILRDQQTQKGSNGMHHRPVLTALDAASMMDTRNDLVSRIIFAYPRVMIVSIIGVLFVILFIEWPRAPWSPFPVASFPKHVPHLFLYTGYLMTMIAVLLEKNGYLPYTSWTWMLAVANWIGFTVWGDHAKHQTGAESIFHTLMSETCLIASLFTMLLAILQVSKKRDILHVSAFLAFYLILLQGLVMFSIAFWYFKWNDPFNGTHYDVPEWQVPCVFSACVFSSLAGLAVVWNYVQYKERKESDNSVDTDSEEALPLS